MTSQQIKEMAYALGTELCGIADVSRFEEAPCGYHPKDVMSTCKSVIAFAVRFPVATLACDSTLPYTKVKKVIAQKVDDMSLELCIQLEKQGIHAVPIPTDESEWDAKTSRKRSIVSIKHAAQAAGLGTIGRHSMLVTPELGSMIWLGAVLTDAPLEADPLKDPVCTSCNQCVDACPVNALESQEMNQQACLGYAFGDDEEKKSFRIKCHKCRDACPYNLGQWNGR